MTAGWSSSRRFNLRWRLRVSLPSSHPPFPLSLCLDHSDCVCVCVCQPVCYCYSEHIHVLVLSFHLSGGFGENRALLHGSLHIAGTSLFFSPPSVCSCEGLENVSVWGYWWTLFRSPGFVHTPHTQIKTRCTQSRTKDSSMLCCTGYNVWLGIFFK